MEHRKRESTGESVKVVFVVPQTESGYLFEHLWAIKRPIGYQIDSIPFMAPSIALGDIVSVELDDEDGNLYFEHLKQASGNSVLRLLYDGNVDSVPETLTDWLDRRGLSYETLRSHSIVAIHIPAEVDYYECVAQVKDLPGVVDYEEACIASV